MKFPLCMGKLYIHSCHALHFYRISTKCDDVCAIDEAEPFIRMLGQFARSEVGSVGRDIGMRPLL